MNTPKISVIVPVYNAERWLGRCIDSILAQTFTDFELLLIDDGSRDSSGDICDRYAAADPRVRVFHKPNGGVSSARNLGLDNARGSWITFVDADDWLAPDALQTVADYSNQKGTDIISCGFWSVTKNQVSPVEIPSLRNGKVPFMREQMLYGWTVVWNTFFKKDFLKTYSLGFDKRISIGEDFELLFRAYYYAENIVVIDKPLYYYNRMNETSALHRMTVEKYDEIIQAYLSVAQFFKDNNIYDEFRDIVSWKILRAKQDYVLDVKTHEKFLSIYPECHGYIFSCPTINNKIKIMMWLLTHKMGWITRAIVRFRNRVKNNV